MHFLLLAAAIASTSATGSESELVASASCTASRLQHFMSPFGIAQSWPRLPALPAELARSAGHPIGSPGNVMDGYSQVVHVDLAGRKAYVAQQGGFAGAITVFGPLPVAACAKAAL